MTRLKKKKRTCTSTYARVSMTTAGSYSAGSSRLEFLMEGPISSHVAAVRNASFIHILYELLVLFTQYMYESAMQVREHLFLKKKKKKPIKVLIHAEICLCLMLL